MLRKWTSEIIVLLLFSLFVYAATIKLMDYKMFLVQMNDQPFDDRFSIYLVWGLPALQFIIAAMLIFKRTMLIGLYSSLVLMLVFTGYIALIKLNFFDHVPCSCGGVIANFSWMQHLYFNLFFVAISVVGIVLHRQRRHITSSYERIQLS
ncbi:MauE/DoxX family redox-associated membrane protein [Chitinophaga sp. GCM10012297]|uniref:Methylamine utilisation protein MauE domain-containing protein n=1 Tax=Chitinophaga chungangae TaxID=2821488 RepID=A0ABS3YJX1_9BACT|nr:MauE/DoxX family redox-associated membrane protein [Chitinophaga chungangae]MBO9154965.1 hypothetical protein [Chitinophaga chungangae]